METALLLRQEFSAAQRGASWEPTSSE